MSRSDDADFFRKLNGYYVQLLFQGGTGLKTMKNHSLRGKIFEYAEKKYGTSPEYPWARFPNYAVLRHADNRKWYGLVLNIPYGKIDTQKSGEADIDILNVKLDDLFLRDLLIQNEGYYIGYHISRGNWLSIALDGTVPLEDVCRWLDVSFEVTASARRRKNFRPPKEWLIPANPRYYDIEHAFDNAEVIDWKQGAGVRKGDAVLMYVGAPVSAILYQCRVLETDIPYEYRSRELTITKWMKIQLERRFPRDRFTLDILKKECGVSAVRGPRGIPHSLSCALKT